LRILITGGTGFVGTHLIQFLKSSRNLRIAVLSSGGSLFHEKGVDYCEVDLRDVNAVNSTVSEIKPQQIYHLAAISAVDVSWKNPRLTYEVNVLGAYNLFQAAMQLPAIPRILNVSTSQVYANGLGPLTETSPVGPDNPYAASKAMAELLVVQYRKHRDGGIITARSFNHTGPDQQTKFVLPSIAKQFAEIELGIREPVLTLGNIEIKRDFTDVRDVVRAYCLLLDKGRTNEVYNVCSGSAVRLADVIRMFESVVGFEVKIETAPELVRPDEAVHICGDPTKIQAETGWRAQIHLKKTVTDLLEYWRSRCRSEQQILDS
jgi:GDP-4-dehydro-6-deoxy-D-mannose reductase